MTCVSPQPVVRLMRRQMAGKMLSVVPTIDPTASVRESKLGRYTEVGARTILLEVTMDDTPMS